MFSLNQYRMSLENTSGLTRTSGEWSLCRRDDGRPWYAAGNTAIVFRVRIDGEIRALRCYRHPMRHLREIYGDRLRERELFLYTGLDRGVWVDVVVDDWIEGETLRYTLFEAARNRNVERIARLSLAFDELGLELVSDDRAHGDLKPENILVDDADRLHPIDLDASYLPAFAGEHSPELGTTAYQHPARTAEDFHAALDDYPTALIATALHALRVAPELLDRYGQRDGLLFDPRHIATDEALREVLALFERHGWAAQYRLARLLYAPMLRLPQLPELLEAARREVERDIRPEKALDFSEAGLELFVENGRWGYRTDTKIVVPPLYDCGFDFTEGLAAVRLNRTWHYIDPTGRPVIACPDCEAVKPFHDGSAVVIRNGVRARIDRTGKIVAPDRATPPTTKNHRTMHNTPLLKRTLVFLFVCIAATTVESADAQQLIFPDSVCNVGDIAENDPPRAYRFRYENRSDKPVVILRVDTSCGCVKSSFSRKPIAPGTSGEIIVTFDPHGREGALYKQMPVYTSASGKRPAIRLALSGTVKPTK